MSIIRGRRHSINTKQSNRVPAAIEDRFDSIGTDLRCSKCKQHICFSWEYGADSYALGYVHQLIQKHRCKDLDITN